jgi:hypothetical protein
MIDVAKYLVYGKLSGERKNSLFSRIFAKHLDNVLVADKPLPFDLSTSRVPIKRKDSFSFLSKYNKHPSLPDSQPLFCDPY